MILLFPLPCYAAHTSHCLAPLFLSRQGRGRKRRSQAAARPWQGKAILILWWRLTRPSEPGQWRQRREAGLSQRPGLGVVPHSVPCSQRANISDHHHLSDTLPPGDHRRQSLAPTLMCKSRPFFLSLSRLHACTTRDCATEGILSLYPTRLNNDPGPIFISCQLLFIVMCYD